MIKLRKLEKILVFILTIFISNVALAVGQPEEIGQPHSIYPTYYYSVSLPNLEVDTAGETIYNYNPETTICFGFPDVNNCGCCECNSDCKCNNCCNDDDKITSFHVRNNGFLAVDWTSPSGWTFNQNNESYVWKVEVNSDGNCDYCQCCCSGNCSCNCCKSCGDFCIKQMMVELENYAGWTIGEAGIDKCDGTWINRDSYLGLFLV